MKKEFRVILLNCAEVGRIFVRNGERYCIIQIAGECSRIGTGRQLGRHYPSTSLPSDALSRVARAEYGSTGSGNGSLHGQDSGE
jgi:hypothetical protein